MRNLYIKQKVFSLGEKFTIKDEQENDVYYVEGSFMKIPKTFQIMNLFGEEVAHITKKTFSLMPKFHVDVNGQSILTIQKRLTLLKARYTIDAENIEVHGNWWDMEFQISQGGHVVGQVNKEWFTWGDSYRVRIFNGDLETIIIAIVIAIDRVKADEASSSSS